MNMLHKLILAMVVLKKHKGLEGLLIQAVLEERPDLTPRKVNKAIEDLIALGHVRTVDGAIESTMPEPGYMVQLNKALRRERIATAIYAAQATRCAYSAVEEAGELMSVLDEEKDKDTLRSYGLLT